MASTTTLLTLYAISGACETAGVVLTVVDVRAKSKAARDFFGTGSSRTFTYGHMERIDQPIMAALTGPWLAIAAALILIGIIVGTVANALSTG